MTAALLIVLYLLVSCAVTVRAAVRDPRLLERKMEQHIDGQYYNVNPTWLAKFIIWPFEMVVAGVQIFAKAVDRAFAWLVSQARQSQTDPFVAANQAYTLAQAPSVTEPDDVKITRLEDTLAKTEEKLRKACEMIAVREAQLQTIRTQCNVTRFDEYGTEVRRYDHWMPAAHRDLAWTLLLEKITCLQEEA